MNSKSHLSLAGILVGLAFALSNFGCGGGQQTAATPPVPPPAITVSVSPASAMVQPGGMQQFTATVSNDPSNSGVTWALTPATGAGTLSNSTNTSVTYNAPASVSTALNVTVTATAVADSAKSSSSGITVPTSSLSVAVTPTAATLQPGATAHLTATVYNDPANAGVTWAISCAPAEPGEWGQPCGALSPAATASGAATTYAAPTAGDLVVTITATSVTNQVASASATIRVPGIGVAVTGGPATVEFATSVQFTAAVYNDTANKGVTWTLLYTQNGTLVSCSSASVCGTVSPVATASGVATAYTGPATPPAANLEMAIMATSVANSTVWAQAFFTIPAIAISVAPGSVLLPVNISQQFTATVGNDSSNKGSNWAVTQSGTVCSPGCGTVVPSTTASGSPTTYTAPAKVPANSAVTIASTSVTDTTKTANAAVTLTLGTVKLAPIVMDLSKGSPQTATLTNVGNTPLNITGITLSDSADFSQTNTCGASLGAGMSCTVTVDYSPQIWCGGSVSATLSISDASVDSPQQISLSGARPQCKHGYEDISAVRSALARSRTAAVPTPSGASNVGTRVMNLVDSTRDDPFLANGAERELLVRLWYPASSGRDCRRAEYTLPAVWSYFSQLVRVPLPEVTTNSCLNAPITEGPHPVVVFTPGYTATFTDYTFLFEDLASRGYIVASVDHTHEATAVQFPDGRLAKSVLGSHLDGSWRLDEKEFSFALSVRLEDLKFVVNELERLNSEPDSPFTGKLDMSRVALGGHSFGGLTAILGVEQDPRFKAGIVIDGFLPGSSAVGPTETPVLLLAAGRKHWSDAERRLWDQLQGSRLAVNLKGAEHVTPTDGVWLAKGAIKTCPMGAEKTIAAVRDYIAAFLDANLLDKPPDPLLSGPSSEYPDAEVITQNELLPGKP